MNITQRIPIALLVAGTLLAGGAANLAQASGRSAGAARALTARPNGVYSAGARKGEPAYESVLVYVDKTGHKVTVDQRCKLNVPGRKMRGTIRTDNTFAVSGSGVAGHTAARGRFIHPKAGGRYFAAVDVAITNGCAAGTRTWDAILV